MHDLGQVAAIIQNDIRGPAIRTFDGFFNAPPEFLFRFTLPGEGGQARGSHGGGGMILG